ncbi:AsmA-like C-terminal region-containing protein [Flavobacterium sp.]|uniref:AsmA-like C-terminal region-containing protein n=1 Tax=Flavobacterium sp. TaxID=239 RepID=UPI00263A25A1|nr:AsmA-like C-terminal region-containing protein [Flavobacterium sp.]MDD2985132.1 AsmA-like C-terminal region-containing protein [Flavobacterium sp.]
MLKKIAKGFGIFLVVIIIALAVTPFLFKGKIKAMVLKSINEKVDATVGFEDVSISLFRNFPNANVSIEKLSIINKAPFAGDTLFYSDELHLKMSVKELFKSEGETMELQSFSSKNGLVNIIFNKDGIGNFDIALKEDAKENDNESKPFALSLQNYNIDNLRFSYWDESSNMKVMIDEIYHVGKGNFAASKLDLNTTTKAFMSVDMDKVNYMNKIPLSLEAVLGIDLDKNKYEFKDNKALINQLPLEFKGFIQLVENGQQYDLTFKTPTSSFKNFLGLIPSAYKGDLDKINTSGDFTVSGFAKGEYTATTIPTFELVIASNNASFKYPDLSKSVENIIIDTKIKNETGQLNDTYINVDKLSFKIDQDVFMAKATIKNMTENALVDAALKGTINLANVTKAYPVKLDKPLTGVLKADITTNFDMQSVEKEQYQNIKNAGTLNLTNFNYTDDNGKGMEILEAMVEFNPSQLNLKQFKAKTGKSDLQVDGVLDNFYGYLFNKQNLKGKFNLSSNVLAVSDFMSTSEPTKEGEKASEAMKIPAFLDCVLTAKANTVLYDNLTLNEVSGKVIIKDEKATLENVKTSIFGGQIGLNGNVSTKTKVPTFAMDLNMSQVNINETFTQLDMMKSIAPIANIINGKLNSTISVAGNLDSKEMTPNLKSITGDIAAQLLSTTINSSNSTLLNALDNQIKFIDLNKINLNDLKTSLTFQDGKVNVKPFDINYQDISMTIGGTHGFDQSMNYNLKFDVPAKYLGTETTALINKLSPADAANFKSIPITAMLTGNFTNPKVSTDIKQATTKLVTQLVEQQKQKLINQGTSALTDLINQNTKPADTTKPTQPKSKEDQIKDQVKDGLNSLFNKNKKE